MNNLVDFLNDKIGGLDYFTSLEYVSSFDNRLVLTATKDFTLTGLAWDKLGWIVPLTTSSTSQTATYLPDFNQSGVILIRL